MHKARQWPALNHYVVPDAVRCRRRCRRAAIAHRRRNLSVRRHLTAARHARNTSDCANLAAAARHYHRSAHHNRRQRDDRPRHCSRSRMLLAAGGSDRYRAISAAGQRIENHGVIAIHRSNARRAD